MRRRAMRARDVAGIIRQARARKAGRRVLIETEDWFEPAHLRREGERRLFSQPSRALAAHRTCCRWGEDVLDQRITRV